LKRLATSIKPRWGLYIKLLPFNLSARRLRRLTFQALDLGRFIPEEPLSDGYGINHENSNLIQSTGTP
jgi:hypothetical protein